MALLARAMVLVGGTLFVAAAAGRPYLATLDGRLVCLAAARAE